MNCATPETWILYFDGALPPGQQAEFFAHVNSCAACRMASLEMANLERLILLKAAEVRSLALPGQAQTELALCQVRARLRDERLVEPYVDALRHFLNGMLGQRAGERMLRRAAGSATITDEIWPGFITSLTRTVSELCGDSAAAVVICIGQVCIGQVAQPGLP